MASKILSVMLGLCIFLLGGIAVFLNYSRDQYIKKYNIVSAQRAASSTEYETLAADNIKFISGLAGFKGVVYPVFQDDNGTTSATTILLDSHCQMILVGTSTKVHGYTAVCRP